MKGKAEKPHWSVGYDPGAWSCPVCTKNNDSDAEKCVTCGRAKPLPEQPKAQQAPRNKAGGTAAAAGGGDGELAYTGEELEKKEQHEKLKEEYKAFVHSKLRMDNQATKHEEFADEIQSLLSEMRSKGIP